MTRKKEIKVKLGARVIKKNKNPYLNPFLEPDGSLDLIERFAGIDFIPYEKIRKGNLK